MIRGLMNDEEWAFFEPFVMVQGPGSGRPPRDHRRVLDADGPQGTSCWKHSTTKDVVETVQMIDMAIDGPEPKVLIADQGSDANAIREAMAA